MGLLNLEATITLLTAITILSLIIGTIGEQTQTISEKFKKTKAKIQAISCAMIANTIYANNFIEITQENNCIIENNKIKSKFEETKSESKTIAKQLTINPENKSIQVKTEKHYW